MQVFHPTQTPKESFLASMGRGFEGGFNKALDRASAREDQERMSRMLMQQGLDPQTAQLYASATTGGRTELLKDALDMRRRGLTGNGTQESKPNQKFQEFMSSNLNDIKQQAGQKLAGEMPEKRIIEERRGPDEQQAGQMSLQPPAPGQRESTEQQRIMAEKAARQTPISQEMMGGKESPQNAASAPTSAPAPVADQAAQKATQQKAVESALDQVLDEYSRDQNIGLTPKERVTRDKERSKAGLPIYQEAIKQTKMAKDIDVRIKELDKLNKSGKLPKNLGRLNVDKQGNLRFPYASTPEAQRWVKNINEFTTAAKESFGARVTNFDLDIFLKRLPNLANSEEGRQQILDQMKIFNEGETIQGKTLKHIFEKAGGVKNIDSDIAIALADKIAEPQIDAANKRLEEIGKKTTLSSLDASSAAQNKGRTVKNKAGEYYKSDGANWVPVGK